jgi:hypothetical protein
MVAHPGEAFSPTRRHVAFTRPVRRACTLGGVPLPSPQEVPMSQYARNCAVGGLVALVLGLVSGFLSA